MDIYIGIDLAWRENNLSGFCVLESNPKSKKLKILDLKLLKSIDEIAQEIQKYKDSQVYVGIDARLVIPNIRSEDLYKKLVAIGFQRDFKNDKVVFEVYTHATIAMLFNNHKILPLKRKKGRNAAFIREQLDIYKKYLSKVFFTHAVFKIDISTLKGQKLQDYEDMLDALLCGYAMYYCRFNGAKFYQVNGEDTFVAPMSPWKVYMLECSDGTLYTGVTNDLQRRVEEHNTSSLGAKYTKVRRPVKLVYFENADDKVHAMQREYIIKQLSRKEKLELINV